MSKSCPRAGSPVAGKFVHGLFHTICTPTRHTMCGSVVCVTFSHQNSVTHLPSWIKRGRGFYYAYLITHL